ncbi:MAG: precorrin-3B C(17)-methyltransferase [Pseudomonadota bacterium]
MTAQKPVVFWFTPSAEATARAAARAIGGEAISPSSPGVADSLRSFFAARRPIVGVCAAGILIRALAPMLGDKWSEPPVLALSEDGMSVVPLLGGHRGANVLALKLAEALKATPALTTAGEVRLGIALDAPPEGWVLENPGDAKSAMAALLAGAPCTLTGEADWLSPLAPTPVAAPGTDRATVLTVAGAAPLRYWRRTLSLGVGCARGCDPGEMIALVEQSLTAEGRSLHEVAKLSSIDLKSDEAAIHALAARIGIAPQFYRAATLGAAKDRLANPSAVVFAEVGCHGVAEGAALTAAGEDATLLIEKHKTANATCAVATLASPAIPGARRGRLSVVGIGPGDADWRTPEASRLIAEAEELVGYGLYIDLLGPLATGKPRKDFPLGGEEDRCRYALEAAAEGRNIALICSGDAGIYAMGALVMELMARDQAAGGVSDAAKRVEIINAPGVSALQAASARAGAILGHDFCTISLSDLLTPREDIIKRLHAAAEGDFVIAFYNPVSKRRRTLLDEARRILLDHRPAETPVLLASNLGRPTEKLIRRTLATLETDEVDMLTVVLIGSSNSAAFQTGDGGAGAEGWRIYTPRGYAKKMKGAA